MYVPGVVGVPVIVITFPAQAAVTPAGRLVAVPMPVAPVVERVIAVNGVSSQSVGFDDAVPAVFAGVTVIVPVAFTEPQPPVNGML